MGKTPAFFFYPGDWMKDPALRSCSLAARGLWIDMLCIFFESHERGVSPYPAGNQEAKAWAKVVGHRADYVKKLVAELELCGAVYRRESDGRLYCKRMMQDEIGRKNDAERQRNHRASSHATVTQTSRPSSSSSSSSSQVLMSLEEEEAFRTAAAAAFRSLESEPYGPILFQKAWAHEFAAPAPPCTCGGRHRCASCKTNGFVDSMERTIQICQRNGITVPGRFYAHKKEIEKSEATALYRKDPQ